MAKTLNKYTRAIVNLSAHRTNEPPALGHCVIATACRCCGFLLGISVGMNLWKQFHWDSCIVINDPGNWHMEGTLTGTDCLLEAVEWRQWPRWMKLMQRSSKEKLTPRGSSKVASPINGLLFLLSPQASFLLGLNCFFSVNTEFCVRLYFHSYDCCKLFGVKYKTCGKQVFNNM